MSETVTTGHQPMEAVHIDDRPWETLRWPGQWSCGIGSWGGQRPSLGGYVIGTGGTDGATAAGGCSC